jgi:hypothetical protein
LVSDLSKTKLNSKVPAGKWQIERSLNGAPIARKKLKPTAIKTISISMLERKHTSRHVFTLNIKQTCKDKRHAKQCWVMQKRMNMFFTIGCTIAYSPVI